MSRTIRLVRFKIIQQIQNTSHCALDLKACGAKPVQIKSTKIQNIEEKFVYLDDGVQICSSSDRYILCWFQRHVESLRCPFPDVYTHKLLRAQHLRQSEQKGQAEQSYYNSKDHTRRQIEKRQSVEKQKMAGIISEYKQKWKKDHIKKQTQQ